MDFFADAFERQPLTRKVCHKAHRRLYRQKSFNDRDEKSEQESVPTKVAAECSIEELLKLLEEHPTWLWAPMPLRARDFSNIPTITISEILRRKLADLIASLLDSEWHKTRSIWYERDKIATDEKDQKLLAFIRKQPGILAQTAPVTDWQLLNGITISSLVDILNTHTDL